MRVNEEYFGSANVLGVSKRAGKKEKGVEFEAALVIPPFEPLSLSFSLRTRRRPMDLPRYLMT